ncbi:hypothetical protein STEG23_027318 [Scotinomys teguina]
MHVPVLVVLKAHLKLFLKVRSHCQNQEAKIQVTMPSPYLQWRKWGQKNTKKCNFGVKTCDEEMRKGQDKKFLELSIHSLHSSQYYCPPSSY